MKYSVTILSLLLAGCTSQWDMQGMDPKDFYAEHPVENTVETKYETYTAHFTQGDRLTADEIDGLRGALHGISPMAAESVQIQLHPSQMKNEKRRDHLSRMMRSMGYSGRVIMFEPSETLEKNDAQINIAYASAVAPHCPDWRMSPVTTYSNTTQANIGCSTVKNIGLMAADPRDLVKGSGGPTPDSSGSVRVIQNYRAGTLPAESSSDGSSTTSAGTAGQ